MISISDILLVLQRRWSQSAPEQIPTQFPGVPLQAGPLNCWFEFWVTQGAEPPQRIAGAETLSVLIDVHCYARSAEKRLVFDMADAVRRQLSQQLLPLPTTDDTSSPCGFLRLREAVIRDLTREETAERQLPLQHLVVSMTGRAEQCCSQADDDSHD